MCMGWCSHVCGGVGGVAMCMGWCSHVCGGVGGVVMCMVDE